MKSGIATILTMGFLACYAFYIASLYPFSGIWLRVLFPLFILIAGYGFVIGGRVLKERKTMEKAESDSSEADRTLGLFYQQQGLLDLAFEKFRPLAHEEEVKDMLYGLGLEYEETGQIQKALVVYKLMIEGDKYADDPDIGIFQPEEVRTSGLMGAQADSQPLFPVEEVTKPAIGGYEISDEIEQDSAGVIFKAIDIRTNKTVSLRTVNLSKFGEDHIDDIRGRFFQEAEGLSLLSHPNIATLYNWGEEQDQFYIVMEYLEGEGLETVLNKEKLLSVRETLRIVGRVAEALDFAHGKDVIHQHIMPAGIKRMEKAKDTKICDFAFAWMPSAFDIKPDSLQAAHFYMSPEQIAGKKVDGRSDIFSLGVVFFEMLTGEKPFVGEDMTTLMLKITREKHPSPRSYNPKIPRVIEQIVDRALEKDLKERYQTAGQMAVHLNKVVARIDELIARKRSEACKLKLDSLPENSSPSGVV
ncbi:MAG: serine/threonine protein kinase [Deltaproteobacteria bacterium]|nr:serine/threonine protein kinase [Deltaproteobacteria bacterium]